MHKLLKITILAIAILLIEGCATHTNFVRKYNSWVGQNISHLIDQIGYPDNTYTLPNKHKVYVYDRSRVYSLPSMPVMGYGYYGEYGMFGYGNDVIQEKCKLFIETDKKGTIVNWRARGNHCVSE
ncbi:MAG: hypothetical protein P794_03940 [Epsilonproteobacteria bacterium (ex Lamellibrachia satsuma)]|nr:MAG: hypothetical protein P794_03940 [Epsilonproteobacteria bacterium (ex Lamellibrachia satsuma)]